MRHDVYHQLGQPLDPPNLDHDGVQVMQEPTANADFETNDVAQEPQPEETHEDDNTDHVNNDCEDTSYYETAEVDSDIGRLIDSELAEGNTWDEMCSAPTSILDEFEDPVDFPTDAD